LNTKSIKTKALKKAFLEAMIKTFGNVTASAKAVGISRETPYQWAEKDPEFEKIFKGGVYEEMLLDAVDAKLAKLAVQDENPTVLIFLAKTKGKKRGYVERSEHDVFANINATVDYSKLSESALQEIAAQLPDDESNA